MGRSRTVWFFRGPAKPFVKAVMPISFPSESLSLRPCQHLVLWGF